MKPALETKQLTLGYGATTVIDTMDLAIPRGQITVLVGSNGSGKSTLLQAMARLLKPKSGAVLLAGNDLAKQSTRKTAYQLAILPQGPVAPEGLTVLQLVKQGRYPHQNWLSQWSAEDQEKVEWALDMTRMAELADRPVNSLSGGQRQRAWIAMTLAQDTETILLDEPTTYLDMAHQIEILDLLFELNATQGRTIIMVLHDLNLACRYAHHMVAIHRGKVHVQGKPEEIVTEQMVKDVFAMDCQVTTDPLFGTPLCVPHSKGRRLRQNQLSATRG